MIAQVGDEPHSCALDVPFLQYSVLGNLTWSPPEDVDWPRVVHNFPTYTRGFAIPLPDAWTLLSQPREQLEAYAACVGRTFPWAQKSPQVRRLGSEGGRTIPFFRPPSLPRPFCLNP